MIPVVYGPRLEDVEKVAPPNSFIHAEHFKSEKELVNYINYLDKNDTGKKIWQAIYCLFISLFSLFGIS